MKTSKLPVKTISLHPRKKIGLCLGILLSPVFAVLYLYIFINLDRMPGKVLVSILFLATIVIFIFYIMAFIILKKERFIGFFISGEGLNDISTGNNYGVVYWRDILKIRIADDLEHPKRKYIVLNVSNPQIYIDREPSVIKRRSLILKYHYYGSPICFSERGLNCTFKELEDYVNTYYEYYQRKLTERNLTYK